MISRKVVIGLCGLMLLTAVTVVGANDDFVEDVYFWASEPVKDADGKIVPHYNPKAKEILYLPIVQLPDSTQAVRKEQPMQPELRSQAELQETPAE